VSHNEKDITVLHELEKECRKSPLTSPSGEKIILPFPTVSKEPEDEYNGLPIFSNAFPWLFPGGIGDINYSKKKENGYVQKWVKAMVYYYDGRFVKDPTWCFYALNYMQRHQNNVSGGFFIRDFITSNKPSNLDALKQQISRKDYSFVDKLIYYSSKIKGSNSYWRLKNLNFTHGCIGT